MWQLFGMVMHRHASQQLQGVGGELAGVVEPRRCLDSQAVHRRLQRPSRMSGARTFSVHRALPLIFWIGTERTNRRPVLLLIENRREKTVLNTTHLCADLLQRLSSRDVLL
jgi:hypothetical protein